MTSVFKLTLGFFKWRSGHLWVQTRSPRWSICIKNIVHHCFRQLWLVLGIKLMEIFIVFGDKVDEDKVGDKVYQTRWWFQIIFIFIPVWGRFPIWLIFFNRVETTNCQRFFPNVFAPFIFGNMFLYVSAFFRQGSLLGRQDLGFGWFWGSPWIPIQDLLYFSWDFLRVPPQNMEISALVFDGLLKTHREVVACDDDKFRKGTNCYWNHGTLFGDVWSNPLIEFLLLILLPEQS